MFGFKKKFQKEPYDKNTQKQMVKLGIMHNEIGFIGISNNEIRFP